MQAHSQDNGTVNSGATTMEPCGNGLWRLSKNSAGTPPSSKKWIHISGPYYREAPKKPTLLDLLRAAAASSQDGPSIPQYPSTRE